MRLWLSFILLAVTGISCQKKIVEPGPEPQVNTKTTDYVKTHNVSVISKGFPGYTTKNLLSVTDTVTKAKPDLIIIMIGVNDVIQGQYANYKNDLIALVDKLRQGQNTDVMLLSPPAATLNGYNAFNLTVASIRTEITEICDQKKCIYVDINSAFSAQDSASEPLILPDNIHPTAAGYRVLAETVLKSYIDNKLSKYTIVCFGDSVTYGWQVTGAGTVTGETYPAQLSRLLNN